MQVKKAYSHLLILIILSVLSWAPMPLMAQFITPSGIEGKELSFLHTLGIKSGAWVSKFQKYLKKKEIPLKEWMDVSQNSYGGMWFQEIAYQEDIQNVKYRDLVNKVHSSRRSVAERNILVLLNVDPEGIWFSATKHNLSVWEEWIKKKENAQKPNRFSESLIDYGYPWHSAFYDEMNILGVLDNGNTPILQNFNLVKKGVVFIPPRFNRFGAEEEKIFFGQDIELKRNAAKEKKKSRNRGCCFFICGGEGKNSSDDEAAVIGMWKEFEDEFAKYSKK